jgi:hypothetical protein
MPNVEQEMGEKDNTCENTERFGNEEELREHLRKKGDVPYAWGEGR